MVVYQNGRVFVFPLILVILSNACLLCYLSIF